MNEILTLTSKYPCYSKAARVPYVFKILMIHGSCKSH